MNRLNKHQPLRAYLNAVIHSLYNALIHWLYNALALPIFSGAGLEVALAEEMAVNAISRKGRAPIIVPIAACWLGFVIGFVFFWPDGFGAALLAGFLAANASAGVTALILVLRSRRTDTARPRRSDLSGR